MHGECGDRAEADACSEEKEDIPGAMIGRSVERRTMGLIGEGVERLRCELGSVELIDGEIEASDGKTKREREK